MNLPFLKPSAFQLREFPDVAIAKGFPNRRGFTLVEIMVSVAILSVMILFLFSVFNMASQAWQSSEKKVDAFREARAALFVMRRDFTGLQVNDKIPLALNGSLVPNLETLSAPSDQVFFVTKLGAEAQGGNALGELCSVGYYVSWSTNTFDASANNFASKSYNLFRYFRNSDSNYINMSNFWVNPSLPNLYSEAKPLPQSGDEVLARNVIGFRVRPYFWYMQEVVTAGVTNYVRTLTATNVGVTADTFTATNKPAFVDVSLSVINYATAGQMGNSAGTWNSKISESASNSIINQNKQDFYMRVPLSQ